MNGEQLHDAMNFLDDDLIEETDALRRGERVIPRKPKIIRWVIPAACLALAIGAATIAPITMESAKNDSTMFENMEDYAPGTMNGAPEYAFSDKEAAESTWQHVTLGPISIDLPPDWKFELTHGADDALFIFFGPTGQELRVGYDPFFGVCGTGLREAKMTIAGMPARAGYYDGSRQWSFIVFTELEPSYVIINDAGEEWWSAHGDLTQAVLDTITIDGEG